MLSRTSLIFILMSSAIPSQAHDPSLHGKDAEQPNCVAMKDMDTTDMAPDDPLMLAMMEQCAAETHDGDYDHADDAPAQAESESAPHIMDHSPDHESSHSH